MSRLIVIMMDPDKRELLRNSGVIPAGMFHPFDIHVDEPGEGLTIWPYRPNYDPPKDPGLITLPSLLGLPEGTDDESMISEIAIGHLFDATLLHVVFLDRGERRATGYRRTTFDSLTSVLDWGDRLKAAIDDRFSEEQSRALHHVLVIVAYDGQVETNQASIDRLNRCLVPGHCLQTCFFLDYNLGFHPGENVFHAPHVWPIMLGRLVLRMMLKNTQPDGQGLDDAVLRPGFHLWRAKEFVFGYPKRELKAVWQNQLKDVYSNLDKTLSGESKQSPSDGVSSSANALPFPPLDEPPPLFKDEGWVDFPVDSYTAKTNDDKRWAPCFSRLKESVTHLKASCCSSDWLQRIMSVFTNVGKSPANIFHELKALECHIGAHPIQDSVDPVAQWKAVVDAEECRQGAKKELEKAATDFSRMQDHYVPKSWGLMAVITVTLFCGISIYRLIGAIGAAQWFSLLLVGCVLFGAAGGWWLVTYFHARAGEEGLKSLRDMGEATFDLMKFRHEQSFVTMKTSWQRRTSSDDQNVSSVLHRLLTRVARILNVELQTPTVEVFFDDKETRKSGDDEPTLEVRQRESFREETTLVEDLGKAKMCDGDFALARDRIKDFFNPMRVRPDDETFAAFWTNLCRRTDTARLGNLPAGVLIPALRKYMQKVCDEVTESLKKDVLAKSTLDAMPKALEAVGGESGFSHASAQVTIDKIEGEPYNELFVSSRYVDEAEQKLRGSPAKPIVRTSPLFSRLPHYALFFQDMIVRPKLAENGRLAF